MSLSEQNRALIERELPFDCLDFANETTRFDVLAGTLARLLDAARAEGVAALQQAADHVADVGKLITAEMVNAAWNAGKDRRMTGLPTDFRAVLEAAFAQQAGEPVDVQQLCTRLSYICNSYDLGDDTYLFETALQQLKALSPLPQQTALVEGEE